MIDMTDNFYDCWNVIKRYKELTDYVQSISNRLKCQIILFGELYGKGIQNRIDYGPEKYFRIFDIIIYSTKDIFILQWIQTQKFIYTDSILKKYLVPSYGIVKGLKESLKYEPEDWNEIEGVIIKPYNKVYSLKSGDVFYLKHKNPKFEEKNKRKKRKEPVKYSDEIENLKSNFEDYINKNRVLSVFSKYGEISEPKQIGEYIKLVLEDAKKDFTKDMEFDINKINKKEQKYIFNVSKDILKILNGYL